MKNLFTVKHIADWQTSLVSLPLSIRPAYMHNCDQRGNGEKPISLG
jgi:hypothetical protein